MNILTDTGLGTCIILLIGMIGIPLAIWRSGDTDTHEKEKPVAATTG